jgi:4-diphosphocytidyl-2-C-methyl-D-erythritol kinase
MGMPMLTVPAYAKINLTLEILGRYDDGFHQITSIMQAIDLHDTLSFEPEEGIRLSCSLPELSTEDNLILRAARLLQEATGCNRGARIHLEKGIPLESGLGGGSSDAAATLRALKDLWEIDLPEEELRALASQLGSDVTFFLSGYTALATGRGQVVTPLPISPKVWVVLLKPPLSLPQKTRSMYGQLQPHHWTSGEFTQRMKETLQHVETIDPLLCYNAFEEVAFSSFPGLDSYRRNFLGAGASKVHLAGAGPTLYALALDGGEAEAVFARLEGEKYLAQTLWAER